MGTTHGQIAIFDVRTSVKWKILEGHQKPVSCVEFDSRGNILASYCAEDLTLRLWKVGNAGFFSTIMGGTGKSIKEFRLDPLKRSSEGKGRSLGKARGCRIRFVDNEKGLELRREDGNATLVRI